MNEIQSEINDLKQKVTENSNIVLELTELGESLKDEALIVPDEIGKCINLDENEAKTLYSLLYKILIGIEKEEKNGNN